MKRQTIFSRDLNDRATNDIAQIANRHTKRVIEYDFAGTPPMGTDANARRSSPCQIETRNETEKRIDEYSDSE